MTENNLGSVAGLSEQEQRALLAEMLRKKSLKRRTAKLSFAQEQMWVLDRLQNGSTVRNILNAVRLTGGLDLADLRRSFRIMVQRHESLRTTFETLEGGEPCQVIVAEMPVDLPLIDLSAYGKTEQDVEINRLAHEETARRFDLTTGPLVRCTLLRLAESEHILLLAMHHIISDGWSMAIFLRELLLLCQSNDTPALPTIQLQYADFAVWQRNRLQGTILAEQVGYWREQLAGAPELLDLPTDHPRPEVQSPNGARYHFQLGSELSAALTTLARREDVTLFMLLLAGFYTLLWRYSGLSDIVLGSSVANRPRAELEGLIGCFANNIVLRAKLSGNSTCRELLRQVEETCLAAYEHQELPFEKLVDELRVKRDLNRNPLFQVMFALQNVPTDKNELRGLRFERMDVEPDTAHVDLRMSLQERADGLGGFLEYNTDLFDRETIELLAGLYAQILTGWAEDTLQSLEQIEIPAPLSRRMAAGRAREARQNIRIAATFTAEPVEDTLNFWMNELDLPLKLEFAPYNQVFQELLDRNSLFSKNKNGFNVVLLRWEDWLRDAETSNPPELIERNLDDLGNALLSMDASIPAALFVLVCPASPGELSIAGRADYYKQLEARLEERLAIAGNILLIPSAELAEYYPVADYYDPQTDALGHIPYTPAMYTAIATLLARKIHGWQSTLYKVIALDCDGTLWDGICGEDGAKGIRLDEARLFLQQFVREQQKMGKLLCLCSKNEEGDVWRVFEQRADMLLKRDEVVAWRINWQPKSENLRSLAKELNLGLDSFIFVDDNPLECAEVRARCPEILTLELPSDPAQIRLFLKQEWAFDQLKVTGEDRQRTQMYRENMARGRLQAETLTYERFIEQLDLKIEIGAPDPSQIERLSQLTQRTNQFNTTTIRRSEVEVQSLCSCVVDVRDRFGAYGLVGAMFYENANGALKVDSFLLSCRAMGRGVEEHMLKWLAAEAGRQGLTRVDVVYNPTPKNQPALDFLERVGKQHKEMIDGGPVFRFPVDLLANLKGGAPTPAPEDKPIQAKAASPEAGAASQPRRKKRNNGGAAMQGGVDAIEKAVRARKLLNQAPRSVEYVAPSTQTHELLAEIWMDVLNLPRVGIHENFFDLGGHSLMVTQVVSRVRKAAQVELGFQVLFKNQTIAELADYIDSVQLAQKLQPSNEDMASGFETGEL